MWIWLDKTGRVKQYLTHGDSPVVGETNFQIFAYFEDLDLTYYDSATIKFQKPDRQGSTYPVLCMKKVTMPYVHMEGDGTTSNFKEANSPYSGFLFDFADFTSQDEIVRLLDTPGLWKATITLLGQSNRINVSGLITFEVGQSASDSEEETEISLDQILQNLILSQSIVKKDATYYVKNDEGFASHANEGTLNPNVYTLGSIVFDPIIKILYKITAVTLNETTNDSCYATYSVVINFNDYVTPDDVPLITASANPPTSAKLGDIWVVLEGNDIPGRTLRTLNENVHEDGLCFGSENSGETLVFGNK